MQETQVKGQKMVIEEGLVRTVRLAEEWYQDLQDPEAAAEDLRRQGAGDLFTFWQRLPDAQPRYSYYRENEPVAVIQIKSYEDWWENQIKGRIRNLIRKCEKKGVEIRQAEWSDDFVQGMVDIFNEAPVRQGRPFWHYGKDFDTVKREFSRFLFREDLIGAYHQGELIGFVMLAHAGQYALTGQIISKMSHRDKNTNNALIAKAVEICAEKDVPYLCYLYWTNDSLAEFKRRCGFEPMDLPRYWIPLTARGRLALKLGLHKGVKEVLPESAKDRLKDLRSKYYYRKYASQMQD